MRIEKFAAAVLFSVMIAAASVSPATAQDAATNAGQAQQTPAGKFIQDIGNRAIQVMASSASPDQRTQQYRRILHDAFDIPTIAHFVLGRAWNSATPQQQQQFLHLFETLVLQTYGDRLNLYSGEKFEVNGARSESAKDTMVSSLVTHPDNSAPTKIDWRVRDEGGGKLAIVDVIIEGVSQSITQRQEYASILQRNNGDMNALLNLMQQRIQQPANTGQQ